MPQFKFVAVQYGDGKPSKVAKSTRSHAIRAGLQKTKRRSRNKAITLSLCSEAVGKDSLLGFKFLMDPVCSSCVDPFNSLPVPTNLQVDHLVKYLLFKFDNNLGTNDRTKAWFPYALRSTPMMHSTLAMAAALWQADCPALEKSIQVEGLRQKGEAMREVGACLAQADSTHNHEIAFIISTMSTLVLVEVCSGDFETAKMHFKGAHNLFSSRGGRDSFKDQFILCKSVNLADIQINLNSHQQS
ncbi:hypothetical protein NW759_008453 [Fusarium solani]|nr:hypothetical protein NW759_008453 [Fusarium solani]